MSNEEEEVSYFFLSPESFEYPEMHIERPIEKEEKKFISGKVTVEIGEKIIFEECLPIET